MMNSACTTKCTPKEVSTIVKSVELRTQRNAANSIASAESIEAARIAGTRAHQARPSVKSR